jgi:phosphoenolpyruvate carboxylase
MTDTISSAKDKAQVTAQPKLSPTARATQITKNNERQKKNECPLVEDIRLLGRILGGVIREQEGPESYELVEQVRNPSVAFRRDADAEAKRLSDWHLELLKLTN